MTWKIPAIIFVFGAVFGSMSVYTIAQEHVHRDGSIITGATGRFYETWKMPDNPAASCCSRQDCYATEIRHVGGRLEARQRENGLWMVVPAKKIERNRDNPDGQNHICASPHGVVYCFIYGGGT